LGAGAWGASGRADRRVEDRASSGKREAGQSVSATLAREGPASNNSSTRPCGSGDQRGRASRLRQQVGGSRNRARPTLPLDLIRARCSSWRNLARGIQSPGAPGWHGRSGQGTKLQMIWRSRTSGCSGRRGAFTDAGLLEPAARSILGQVRYERLTRRRRT